MQLLLLLLLLLSSLEIGEKKSPKISLTLLQQILQKVRNQLRPTFTFRYTENWKSPPFLKTVEGHMNPQQNLGPNCVQLEF
jgi:hypothetical protein